MEATAWETACWRARAASREASADAATRSLARATSPMRLPMERASASESPALVALEAEAAASCWEPAATRSISSADCWEREASWVALSSLPGLWIWGVTGVTETERSPACMA
ncbi:MAG: hypothetical protein IPG47_17985 [Thermoflexaceae bacterium]|nr:hypothetical protein [Thermoflexaceae bacterium]